MEELLADANATEREVGQGGEGERATVAGREAAVFEVKHPEGGEAERGGGENGLDMGHGVTEDQVLDRVEHRQAEPVVEEAGVGGVGEVEVPDGEAADGAPVSSKDLGEDDSDALVDVVRPLEAVVEVERRGAPQVAPAAGEDGGAGALLGLEEGDYGAEHAVWEAAYQIRPLVVVGADLFAALPLPLPLLLPGEDDAVHVRGIRSAGCRG